MADMDMEGYMVVGTPPVPLRVLHVPGYTTDRPCLATDTDRLAVHTPCHPQPTLASMDASDMRIVRYRRRTSVVHRYRSVQVWLLDADLQWGADADVHATCCTLLCICTLSAVLAKVANNPA